MLYVCINCYLSSNYVCSYSMFKIHARKLLKIVYMKIVCSLPCMQIDFWHNVYCDWYEGINLIGENMSFQCPSDGFMAGIKSTYDFAIEDRVYVNILVPLS